ncbi:MAG TPA: hypothetical protein VFB73_15015 [Chloroflexota bacterium]|nr:hypothetical protein [Chloroflexota bacterium]HZU07275.1 hypothetical protein [Chloroflexota bacterium]
MSALRLPPLFSVPGKRPRRAPEAEPALGLLASPAPEFLASLHPLHRRFLAYRAGWADQPHSLAETAEHFRLDLAAAQHIERYLHARYRLYVATQGWRAAQAQHA